MNLNTMTRMQFAFAGCWLALALTLVACDGGQETEGPGADLSFKARANAMAASGIALTVPTLNATERAEAQQRSRAWAVDSLSRAEPGANALTVPPLYFGLAFSVEAAADGDTLRDLRAAFPAVSTEGVRAELQRGLQRKLRAGETTILGTAFFNAVTLSRQPNTLATITLLPLDATQLQAEPNLRLSIEDRAAANLPWAVVSSSPATWISPAGGTVAVTVLRISAATYSLAGAGWTGQAMRMPSGQWMAKIEPTADITSWGPAELQGALAAATAALAEPGIATDRVWELPQMGVQSSGELGDIQGLGLAQDRVNANLRFLDGGGTYLELKPARPVANMSLAETGLSYAASRQLDFIFSPLNLFGGGTAGSIFTNVTINFRTCPAATLNLRPFYMAVLQPNGTIALLSRLNTFSGEFCTRVVYVGPG